MFNNSVLVIGISLFYINFGKYSNIMKELKGLKPLIEKANILINRMKELYNKIQQELEFILKRIAKYTNRRRSKGLDLRKGGIVYLLRKNIKTK